MEKSIKTLQNEIMNNTSTSLASELESLIIKGLKNKGFEFNNKTELENFIKSRCKREDHFEFKKHIYYVDDIPFFVHYYQIILEQPKEYNDNLKITANLGEYKFL